ncbi:MAG: hypothetical protein AAF333_07255 [Planctomycetota bacterium]
MQVYLDEQPIELPGPSLGTLLDAARRRLADDAEGGSGGRVVVEVAVDGHKLGEDQITARADEDLGDLEVRLVTADPKQLAVDTLEQVRGRLGEAQELQQEAADLLQQDQTQPALQKVGESIEAWLQVQQAVLQSAVLLSIDLDKLDIDGQPAHALTAQALERLEDIKAFIQANDTVALADALQYEWPETTTQWHRLIDEVVAAIQA